MLLLLTCTAAVRLRRTPAVHAPAECPPVRVDPATSAVIVDNPTLVAQVYESRGPCDDASEAAQATSRFTVVQVDGAWKGVRPLPSSHATRLCARGQGCVGDYSDVPTAPRDPVTWTPLSAAWPLHVLHVTIAVFAALALLALAAAVALLPRAFEWFEHVPPEPPVSLPETYELVGEVAGQLAKMFAATASLWILLFVFVVRRSVTPVAACALVGIPLVLLATHTVVLVTRILRTGLYYALFSRGIHLLFPEKNLLKDNWPIVLVLTAVFLAAVGHSLWMDTPGGWSSARLLLVVAKMWAILAPLGYSIYLLYADDQFVWKLRPLHALFTVKSGHKMEEANAFIHTLTNVPEDAFVAGGNALHRRDGGLVDPAEMLNLPEKVEPVSMREKFAALSWAIPIAFSSSLFRFRCIIAAVVLAQAGSVLMVGGMVSYYMHLYPTLASVEVEHGAMEPAFHPHTFHYTILVDKHVKGENLGVVPDQDLTTAFRVYDGVQESVVEADVPGGVGHTYIPYLRLPDAGPAGARAMLQAQEQPVTFHVDAVGAGTKTTYTFTVVKTQTIVSQLTYTYLAGGENQTVVRELSRAAVVASAEGTDADHAEEAGEDGPVEIYIPPTTEAVDIELSKELVLYGPKKRVVDPAELGWLEAGASVHMCPPGEKECTSDRRARVALAGFEAGVVAVPVVLAAKGGLSATFTISLVRVENRLTHFRAETFSPGQEWVPAALTPAFDPLTLHYEVFFVPPERGDLFVKLTPLGDPKVNYVRMTVNAPAELTVEPFCRHPEAFLIPERGELDCETDDKAFGVKYGTQVFHGHTFLRIERSTLNSEPFEVSLNVTQLEQHPGVRAEARAYSFTFLPQLPMRLIARLPNGLPLALDPPFRSDVLDYVADVPRGAGELTLEMAPASSFWASTSTGELAGGERTRPTVQETVPVSSGPCDAVPLPTSYPGQQPGDDVDRSNSEALHAQQLAEPQPAAAPVNVSNASANASVARTALCPVQMVAYERRPDFPRVFQVKLWRAAAPALAFVGTERADGTRVPLPGFLPSRRELETVIPVEGPARLLVFPPATAAWNGVPLLAVERAGITYVELSAVRGEICACESVTGCGETVPAVRGAGCRLTLSREGEQYQLLVRESATSLRLEVASA